MEIIKYIKIEVVKDIVIIAFYTGMRLGEIINLTWNDVNLKDKILTIGSSNFQTKTRKAENCSDASESGGDSIVKSQRSKVKSKKPQTP